MQEIVVDNVTKAFRSLRAVEATVLDGVTFTVKSGSIACLVGPSGCGKSTLLNLIAGFEEPTTGNVRAGGRDVQGPSVDRVMIFQDVMGSLMPWLTARRNVEFGMRMIGIGRPERGEVAERLLRLVGLGTEGDKYPSELSGGMQQRVQIARALALEPEVMLMDEPFGALDFFTRIRLHEEIQKIHRETPTTILFVTHDMAEAAALGDAIHVMDMNGRIVDQVENPSPRPRTVFDTDVVEIVKRLMAHADLDDLDSDHADSHAARGPLRRKLEGH